jgi:hypothetical protein
MDVKLRVTRKRLMLAIAAAALVTAGGAGYAAVTADGGPVISACMLKATGTIRLYDASAPANTLVSKPCNAALETPVSWNQHGLQGINGNDGKDGINGTNGTAGKDGAPCLPETNPACIGPKGPSGKDGVSVASGVEPVGANCSHGGSWFTAANGTTYACNGAQGSAGADGAPGAPGAPCSPTNPACVGPKGEPGAKGDPCLSSDPACIGPKGDKGDPGTTGALWTVVQADGTQVREHGTTGFPSRAPGAGNYRVEWGSGPPFVGTDISQCAYVGTLIGTGGGEISVELSGASRLVVVTTTSAGVPVDHAFTVAVLC